MRLRELRVMGQFNRHGSPRLPGLRNHASEGCRAANRSIRSEEHTSELQSHSDLVCRLLLEKKKKALAYALTSSSRTLVTLRECKVTYGIFSTNNTRYIKPYSINTANCRDQMIVEQTPHTRF